MLANTVWHVPSRPSDKISSQVCGMDSRPLSKLGASAGQAFRANDLRVEKNYRPQHRGVTYVVFG
jgi:hypothetical protein